MSHIVEIKTQIRDPAAVQAACRRLGLPQAVNQIVKLFSANATGLAVQLPGWRYPIVCDLAAGSIQYDDFGGHWGDKAKLEQFLQAYSAEKAKLEAHKRGHSVTEQTLANGSIKLTVHVSGGAT